MTTEREDHGSGEPEDDAWISASVSADELTFHEVPRVRSRSWGHPNHEGTSGSERTGLPRENVQTGVVYEDVHADYRLTSRIRVDPPDSDDPQE